MRWQMELNRDSTMPTSGTYWDRAARWRQVAATRSGPAGLADKRDVWRVTDPGKDTYTHREGAVPASQSLTAPSELLDTIQRPV
jgi:hypothetical protein